MKAFITSGVVLVALIGISFADPEPPSDANAHAKYIKIETKILGVDEAYCAAHPEEIEAALKGNGDQAVFANAKGADRLSAPTVTTKDGAKVQIEVGDAVMTYPTAYAKNESGIWAPSSFEKKKLGVGIELTPIQQEGKITIYGVVRITDCAGFTPDSDGRHASPDFTTREIRIFKTVNNGQTVAVSPQGNYPAPSIPPVTFQTLKAGRLIIFLTATLTDGPSPALASAE